MILNFKSDFDRKLDLVCTLDKKINLNFYANLVFEKIDFFV